MNASPSACAASSSCLPSGSGAVEVMNSECFCIGLDESALRQAFESESGKPGLFDLIKQPCHVLFASRPFFYA
jgi:hypothetical protein